MTILYALLAVVAVVGVVDALIVLAACIVSGRISAQEAGDGEDLS